MDPFSITASALGLADITARLVRRVARFVRDGNSVDEVLRAFYSEVSTLDINLRLVGKTILSHMDLTHIPESDEFLSSVGDTIKNIDRTVQRLQRLVPETPPKESSNTFQKFLKHRSLDKKLPEISMLRLEMVSYNSSLQTVLQAIDISLNIRIKTQMDPSQFADSFFRATNALEEQLTQLRTDIMKLDRASKEAEEHEEEPQIEPVVTSMRAAEVFAQRIHSKASTMSTAQSEYNKEILENSIAFGQKTIPSRLEPNSKLAKARPLESTCRADLELLQAQESLRQAREKYNNGDFSEAKDLCSEALEELSEVESGPVDAYIEYTVLLQASIFACTRDSEDVIESRRLIKTIDVQQLLHTETDDLVLDRILLLCWTKLRLSDFDEAENLTRILIRDSREWGGDESNHHYNEARVILAITYYCQSRAKKARSLVKIIPIDYLLKKFQEKGFQSKEKVPKDMQKDMFCRLSRPGYEAAAFYYVHYEYPNNLRLSFPPYHLERELQAQSLAIAVGQNSIPFIAMLATCGPNPVATNGACQCHEDVACPDMRNIDSPWEIAMSRNLVLDFTPLVVSLLKEGDPHIFKSLSNANSGKAVTPKFREHLMKALSSSIEHDAIRIAAVLLASYTDLDLTEAFSRSRREIEDIWSMRSQNLVDLLVVHGFKIDGINGIWLHPLHDAVQCRDHSMVEWVIKKGAQIDISITDSFAHCTEEMEVLDAALALNFDPQTSLTPLQLAVVKYLADPDSRPDLLEKVEILVRAGADPTTVFLDGQNCIHLALRERHFDLFDSLILDCRFMKSHIDRRYDGYTILQWTLHPKRNVKDVDDIIQVFNIARSLVNDGADPMVLDDQGRSCFHLAARHDAGAWILIGLLKSRHPIDLEHRDKSGNTAADLARRVTSVFTETQEEITGDEAGEYLLSILRDAGACGPRGTKLNSTASQTNEETEFKANTASELYSSSTKLLLTES